MKFVGDLHIHSHFSIATSKQLAPEHLDYWARIKGISVVGTGDFTHQGWLQELQEKIEPAENGLFCLKKDLRRSLDIPTAPNLCPEVRFVLSAEISSIYKKAGRVRKVHNVILAPDFNTVDKIRNSLTRLGVNLAADGRPIMGLDSRDLLEIALEASPDIYFIPAHIWTPWFSILGSKSGFDRVEECFEDLSPHISAVETGLSTDAAMNWMCSFLDRYTLISNSDAHSPEKLGRNANIFDTELNYFAMIDAMKNGNSGHFLGTVDLFPQEGKYHYDGHRKCGVCWDPLQTLKHNEICSKCGKKITVGVMNRVAQLSDREDINQRPNRLPFISIIPLKEILGEMMSVGPASKRVDAEYFSLIRRFGPELYILLDMPMEDLRQAGKEHLAEAIHRMRERRVLIQEGYDGEYGVVKVFKANEHFEPRSQHALFDSSRANASLPPRELINFDVQEFQCLLKEQVESEPTQIALPVEQTNAEPETWLSGLNPQQLQAVKHDVGPALIIAGPGTGKTRTLTFRIVYLIQERGVSPQNILAVTFTNKAAKEIRERLCTLLHTDSLDSGPMVATFHSFGYSILKQHYDLWGRNQDFTILDENDKLRIIRDFLTLPQKEASALAAALTEDKQMLKKPESITDLDRRQMFLAYQQQLQAQNAFDLDDCIYAPSLLFSDHPDICSTYRDQYTWILIDEYQDINFAQYKLVTQLFPEANDNLCVIGDPDQAIYGFRGADVSFIQTFLQNYPQAATYTLGQSYRCSETILKASAHVIASQIQDRSFLQGWHQGVKITISSQPTDRSEAEYVARTIEEIMGGLGFFSLDSDVSSGQEHADVKSLAEIAVLCRIKDQMRAFHKAFQDHNIPYQTIGTSPFFQQEPYKTIIDILKFRHNPQNVMIKNKLLSNEQLTENTLNLFLSSLPDSSLESILDMIFDQLFSSPDIQLEDFETLKEIARDYDMDLEGFIKFVALGSGVDTIRPELENVSLMTLHAAKGLEFKCVFIPGCEHGLLPYALFPDQKSDVAEEQRLLYVGMTRAERLLFFSFAQKRFLFGKEYRLSRSPFLDNIEEELLEEVVSQPYSKPKDKQMKLF